MTESTGPEATMADSREDASETLATEYREPGRRPTDRPDPEGREPEEQRPESRAPEPHERGALPSESGSAEGPGAGESDEPGLRAPDPETAPVTTTLAATEPETVVHPRVWQRRVAVLREQGRRRLRFIVGGVAVLVALCVALLVLHTPLLALRHVTVRGADHTGTEAVLQAAGLLDHPPLIDVDPKAVASQVEALPWVAHAVVVRQWPDSVTVIVTERVPLGSVARPGGGVAVVDASGRVLAWQSSAPPGLVLVAPVTPGLPGTVLNRAAGPALRVAAALPAALVGRVVTVTADAVGSVTLDLGGGVTAKLGSTTALEAKFTAVATVLAGVHVSGPAVIDVSIPDEPTVGPPPARGRS
jgi:cell division protein FtsQ